MEGKKFGSGFVSSATLGVRLSLASQIECMFSGPAMLGCHTHLSLTHACVTFPPKIPFDCTLFLSISLRAVSAPRTGTLNCRRALSLLLLVAPESSVRG